MFAAAKNLGEGGGGMGDLLTRLRAREKARHGLQVRLAQINFVRAHLECPPACT